jgi:predicted amino acid dehydrogenase
VGIRDSHTRDAQAGVQLKSKATVSERRVRVTLDDGQTAEHTVFWLAKTTPAGVLDPDDEDADDIINASRA